MCRRAPANIDTIELGAHHVDRSTSGPWTRSAGDGLTGVRIFLVEDDAIIAMDLTTLLEEAGARVIGPFARLSNAMEAFDGARPDAALLDIQIVGGDSFPLARRLHDAGVPIVFHSGSADVSAIERAYPKATLCPKPSSPEHVLRSLVEVIDAAG